MFIVKIVNISIMEIVIMSEKGEDIKLLFSLM